MFIFFLQYLASTPLFKTGKVFRCVLFFGPCWNGTMSMRQLRRRRRSHVTCSTSCCIWQTYPPNVVAYLSCNDFPFLPPPCLPPLPAAPQHLGPLYSSPPPPRPHPPAGSDLEAGEISTYHSLVSLCIPQGVMRSEPGRQTLQFPCCICM